MMGERYHATTQNGFYPNMCNVNKNITVEAKLISPPTYNSYIVIVRTLWLALGSFICYCQFSYLCSLMQWGDLGVDGWIILGRISRRWDVGIWTGLSWPRIETGGGRL